MFPCLGVEVGNLLWFFSSQFKDPPLFSISFFSLSRQGKSKQSAICHMWTWKKIKNLLLLGLGKSYRIYLCTVGDSKPSNVVLLLSYLEKAAQVIHPFVSSLPSGDPPFFEIKCGVVSTVKRFLETQFRCLSERSGFLLFVIQFKLTIPNHNS